jgi:hypothetical protein
MQKSRCNNSFTNVKKSHSRYGCETNLLRVTNSRIENLPVV